MPSLITASVPLVRLDLALPSLCRIHIQQSMRPLQAMHIAAPYISPSVKEFGHSSAGSAIQKAAEISCKNSAEARQLLEFLELT